MSLYIIVSSSCDANTYSFGMPRISTPSGKPQAIAELSSSEDSAEEEESEEESVCLYSSEAHLVTLSTQEQTL